MELAPIIMIMVIVIMVIVAMVIVAMIIVVMVMVMVIVVIVIIIPVFRSATKVWVVVFRPSLISGICPNRRHRKSRVVVRGAWGLINLLIRLVLLILLIVLSPFSTHREFVRQQPT